VFWETDKLPDAKDIVEAKKKDEKHQENGRKKIEGGGGYISIAGHAKNPLDHPNILDKILLTKTNFPHKKN